MPPEPAHRARKDLTGRVALVTGAARRIGASIVHALHDSGASVAFTYRSSDLDARALADALNAQRDGSALALHADLIDTPALPALVARVVEVFGGLDLLVNNASSFYPTPIGEITEDNWTDLIGSNLKAPVFLAQAAAGHLKKRGGVIINMVDIHARKPLRGHIVYCAAKAGLAMLTASLARELGPAVRVNGIAPGPILWPDDGITEDVKKKIVANTALKRAGSPEDIASLVVYLARDAVYVTGQIIAVDGGRSVGW